MHFEFFISRFGLFCGSFLLSVFRVCHVFLSVRRSLVTSCWERADLLALLCVMFYCEIVTFLCGVLGQVVLDCIISVLAFFLTSAWNDLPFKVGAQWLSGRVFDWRLRGCGFEPHWRHCVVVLGQETFILA